MISAADGEQALRLEHEHLSALILLNVMLPKMTGPEVMRILKNDPITAEIPVMLLTGWSQQNATRLEKAGASGYFREVRLDAVKESRFALGID